MVFPLMATGRFGWMQFDVGAGREGKWKIPSLNGGKRLAHVEVSRHGASPHALEVERLA
jgi:hypothetical protein